MLGHKPKQRGGHEIEVSKNALPAHMAPGDTEGACEPTATTTASTTTAAAPNTLVPRRRRRRRSRRRSPTVHRAPMPAGTAKKGQGNRKPQWQRRSSKGGGKKSPSERSLHPHRGQDPHARPSPLMPTCDRRGRRRWDQRARGRGDARTRRSRGRRPRAVRARPQQELEPRAVSHLPALVSRAAVGRACEGRASRLARARGGDRRAADRVHGPARARRDVRGRARRVRRPVGGARPGSRRAALRDPDRRSRAAPAGGGHLARADVARRALTVVARRTERRSRATQGRLARRRSTPTSWSSPPGAGEACSPRRGSRSTSPSRARRSSTSRLDRPVPSLIDYGRARARGCTRSATRCTD